MELENKLANAIADWCRNRSTGSFTLKTDIQDPWYGRASYHCSGRYSYNNGYPWIRLDTCTPYTSDGNGGLTDDNTIRLDTLRIAEKAEKIIWEYKQEEETIE